MRTRRLPKQKSCPLQVEQLEKRELLSVTPDKFVAGVYKDLLHRPADASGLQYWSGQIAGGVSEVQVVQQIEQSPEARQAKVRQLFTDLLGRKADGNGVDYFAAQFQAGASLSSVERVPALARRPHDCGFPGVGVS